ncbi:MAG TPA: PAS domain S-box protein [Burkholderiales bacterium]|nr:PAS domain S-box protein [Burkholderiales bacterium]
MARNKHRSRNASSRKSKKIRSPRKPKSQGGAKPLGHKEVRQAFFESAPDAIVVVDSHGLMLQANAQVPVLFGYPREELIGKPVEILMPERFRVPHASKHQDFVAEQRTRAMGVGLELYGQRKDGSEFPVDIMLSPVRSSGKYYIIAAIRDVSEQKKAEHALREVHKQLELRVEQRTRELSAVNRALRDEVVGRTRAEEALLQAQKLEAIGQLTGGVAHDFNNLLTVISGNLQMLRERVAHAPVLSELADAAMKAGERGADLTRKLLAFSRRQPLQPREINISELVQSMTDMLQRTLGETIRIETALQPGLAKIVADPGGLENALLNLALNSRDAMPQGGQLTIETASFVPDSGNMVGETDMAPGEYVILAVSDTGCGMSQEVMKRAFEPFFTTKGAGKGSGLGLASVYGFVKQSGGHIKINSEFLRGTTVQLFLPQAKGYAEATGQDFAAGDIPRADGETVLLVEDDESVRKLASTFLRELGYAVLEAADAEQALAALESGRAIDLMFTDLVMPGGMNGMELGGEVLRRRPAMKVLYTSGYSENAVAQDGKFDGSTQLISKPYTKESLGNHIRRVLDQ